ncbi:acyltransferase [Bradyrhizobium genosp. L]|nr:acyltransferase [Bradyrhizobium genosp. L]
MVRFEALDAIRGISALLVVLFHIPLYHALKGEQSFANLQFCVDMFFALSGFVLCHAYGSRLRQGTDGIRFATARFARLWPLHVIMLVLFVGIEITKLVFTRGGGSFALDSAPFGEGHTLWEAVTNILFLQAFHLHPGLTWNGAAWSAALEFYVSLLFAAVVIVFPRRRREIFLALCLAAGALLFRESPDSLFVSSDWGVLRAMFSFFAGCLVYDMRLQSNGRLATPHLLEVWSVLLFAVFLLTTPKGGLEYAFPLLAAIVIYVFSFDQGIVSALMRTSPLQKLGLWSYSIYMIHTFLFQVMRMVGSYLSHKLNPDLIVWYNDDKLLQLGSPGTALVLALVLSVVLVVPLAALTYRWIERPAMDFGRGLSRWRGTDQSADGSPNHRFAARLAAARSGMS